MIRSVFKSDLFSDKVAIVTGGSTGIGATIVKELAHLGCDVVIASRNGERCIQAAAEMNSNPDVKGTIYPMTCNIRKDDQVKQLMQDVVKKFGKIDFLVNNGGGQFRALAENISAKGWHAVIDTNLNGTFHCCRHAYLEWMKENGGVIVNISIDFWRGYPYMSHSSAARAGVDNLCKSLAIEWMHNGVRINSVAAGTVYSPTAAANYPDPTVFDEARKRQPSGRLAEPEEISAAVSFLLSPAAAYITGETLKVDGAQCLYNPHYVVPNHDKMVAYKWSKL